MKRIIVVTFFIMCCFSSVLYASEVNIQLARYTIIGL